MHFLPCGEGDLSQCEGRCEHRAGEFYGKQWGRCPIRETREDRRLVAAQVMRRQSQAGMHVDAGSLVAWASEVWLQLEHAVAARRAEESSRG